MPEKELNTEELIKEAAKKIFVKKGFAGARMQEIADEAGINKALLHYYYRNKAKLFEVIFDETFHVLLPRLSQILTADTNLIEKLETFIPMYIHTIRQNPHIPLFVLNELNQDSERFIAKVQAKVDPSKLMGLMQQIQESIEAGVVKPFNPIQLFLNVLSMCAFPFVARPVLQSIVGMSDDFFDQLMEEREQAVLDFVKAAILPSG